MQIFAVHRIHRTKVPPANHELIAVHEPVVGEGMQLYRSDNGRRVCTTRVERVLRSESGSVFVETQNSVYRLETLSQMPLQLTGSSHDW